jgi:MoxR-like ATPase
VNRVQCTNELLPSDLLGFNMFNAARQAMVFQPGPVFSQVLLVDELNRAPSKTQSALLQAMEEGEVTIDGVTHPLPRPFCVIATQNPREHVGVYALPESQLDRFSICISMPRPSRDDYQRLLVEGSESATNQPPVNLRGLSAEEAMAEVARVELSPRLIAYALDLVEAIEVDAGLDLAIRYRKQLLSLVQATAFLEGRAFAIPDDLQAVFPASLRHRLASTQLGLAEQGQVIRACLAKVKCP